MTEGVGGVVLEASAVVTTTPGWILLGAGEESSATSGRGVSSNSCKTKVGGVDGKVLVRK